MSNLSSLLGVGSGLKPKSLDYLGATGAWPAITGSNGLPSQSAVIGSTTANTLKTVLSITGSGAIGGLAVSFNAIARDNRIKITLDGTVILDQTRTQTAFAQDFCLIGNPVNDPSSASAYRNIWSNDWMTFDNSLLIEYASTLTETNSSIFYFNTLLR